MEQFINFIIRPLRSEYNPKNDLLDQEFMLKGKWYQRKDLEVVNSRGDVLQCSHYMPMICPAGHKRPCVIYCHGNSGCRMDASEVAVILLPLNITVFTLDFSGSGLSGGDHVTLGWNEKDDLRAVVNYLRSDRNVSLIGLWGRSMGAVTSLMYGAEDPSIAGMVLDSPFSDLVDLMMELVDTFKVRLPRFTLKFAIQFMRRAIQKKAKFDIMDLNTIKVAKSCFVPALFGHAIDDDFVQPHHSDRIFDAYVGDKNIIKFEGDHNSPRPQFYFDSISIFFKNILHPPEDEVGSTYFDSTHDYFGKGRWSMFYNLEFDDELLDSPVGRAATGTEDATRELRYKRPIEVESMDSDSYPSSSNMISFELSKSSPHASLVHGLIDNGEYMEYPLDNLTDFPTKVDEEERMLMEAVRESLEDSETKRPFVKQLSSNGDNELSKPKPEPKSEQEDSNKLLSEISPKCTRSSEAKAQESCSSSDISTCNINLLDAGTMDSSKEEETSGTTSHNDTPSGNQRLSDFDISDRTRVIVKVEKNQTNLIDGLLRRWDFNFFRNR
ncbi:putative alpha/beta hydrolase [Handroanthus impetiginosus]|uniref:Putative alpha/beta hydrolase n=1 Tax=Handroanthus impetiginosus TaxID=429701 RepID=A0A2G9HD85_9LAMI|nr:putative alpha/beta hydrolase [Handroanthus impetiginosus]